MRKSRGKSPKNANSDSKNAYYKSFAPDLSHTSKSMQLLMK